MPQRERARARPNDVTRKRAFTRVLTQCKARRRKDTRDELNGRPTIARGCSFYVSTKEFLRVLFAFAKKVGRCVAVNNLWHLN